MRLRTAALASVVVGLVVSAPARAAVPSCRLFEDAKGDTFAVRYQDTVGGPYGPQEDSLDIVSGDLAGDATNLTAVIRVVGLEETAATSPGGLSFRVQFIAPTTAEDENLWLAARVGSGEPVFTAGYRAMTANVSTKLADVKGVFDYDANEVRITAPLKTWDSRGGVKLGSKLMLSGLDQTTSRFVAVNPATGADTAAFADVTTSDSSYKVGDKSCLAVGK